MPQNNDEHGGSGRNFLQVVSSRMAAVSSTALELLSKSGRWIVLVLPLFFNVSSPSACFKTVETIWHNCLLHLAKRRCNKNYCSISIIADALRPYPKNCSY
ncbi:Ferrochelatase [Trichinella spiralis]|uniref:Ferrochelatase n=1 Tax=Trichinella spiralis TaxID=6334 RepID=A0ABR3KFL3_TRISP